MINFDDTICAISTAGGQGAIAMLRLSGQEALTIADKIFISKTKGKKLESQQANTLHYGNIESDDLIIDDVICSIFKAPTSYTGEDIVEISCHGSVYIQQKILELLVSTGARLAAPGEFTQRAFLNGKLDLSQAEGVADLIASGSEASHKLAFSQMRGGFSQEIQKLRNELLNFISLIELELDFSEEEVEFADRDSLQKLVQHIDITISKLIQSFEYGNAVKNGIPVSIIGRTNAGKSTLLNQLLREDKAIVSEIHGTTRDYIEDTIILQGIQFRFIDTAGLRNTTDSIETQGIQRTLQKYRQASMVLVMVDVTEDVHEVNSSFTFLREENSGSRKLVFILNKTDLVPPHKLKEISNYYISVWGDIARFAELSAKKGVGLDQLENLLISMAINSTPGESDVVVTNVRHFEALKHAYSALGRARKGIENSLPTDLLAQDIREVLHYLGEITGEITTDEILGNIFSKFCIGK